MADLSYLAGYAAAQHNWPDAQVITPQQLPSQAPTGPPLIVTSTSKDLTADTARTIAALHTTGRECILVTDQPPPDTITQWLPSHACITPATSHNTGEAAPTSAASEGTDHSKRAFEEALEAIRNPWGEALTEYLEDEGESDFIRARAELQGISVQLIPDRWTVWGGLPWDGSMQDWGGWGSYDWSDTNLLGRSRWDMSVLAMLHFQVAGVDSLGAIVEPEQYAGWFQGVWLNGSAVATEDKTDGSGQEYRWGRYGSLTHGDAYPWLGVDVPPPLPPNLRPGLPGYQMLDIGIFDFLQNLGRLLLDWGTVNLPPPMVVDSFNTFWNSLMSEDPQT